MLSSLFLSHNYSLYLYSGDLQTTTFGHTQLHKRLTEFLLTLYPLCLTLLYTHVLSLTNVPEAFSPSRKLYRDCLYMCILTLVYPFRLHACCYWFTWIVFDVFVSVYFVHVACCVFAYVYLMLMLLVVYL